MLSTTYLKVCAKEQCSQLAQTETGTVDEQLQLVCGTMSNLCDTKTLLAPYLHEHYFFLSKAT